MNAQKGFCENVFRLSTKFSVCCKTGCRQQICRDPRVRANCFVNERNRSHQLRKLKMMQTYETASGAHPLLADLAFCDSVLDFDSVFF